MAGCPSEGDQAHSPAGICYRVTNTHTCQARVTSTHLHILQMGRALDFLKVQRFMHSDIKLENVMLVNHQKEPFRVKLIDFGLADKVSRVEMGQTIQTLPYRWTLVSRRNIRAGAKGDVALTCLSFHRSPEVFLVLPLTEATDMWSLGCLAAALLLGNLLYHGKSDYDIVSASLVQHNSPLPFLCSDYMFALNVF